MIHHNFDEPIITPESAHEDDLALSRVRLTQAKDAATAMMDIKYSIATSHLGGVIATIDYQKACNGCGEVDRVWREVWQFEHGPALCEGCLRKLADAINPPDLGPET